MHTPISLSGKKYALDKVYHIYLHKSRTYIRCTIPYSAKCWRGKTSANRSFQSFDEENVDKFTIANISYLSESGIWLGKILANDICFPPEFCAILYCIYLYKSRAHINTWAQINSGVQHYKV